MLFDKMGIDIWEAIEAAKTKPFGFQAFYPGPGLGGHCIPIDPFYLTWKAREYDFATRFIELAGEINTSMPDFVVSKVVKVLNDVGKSVKGSKILILGLAYKANVDDERESPSYRLMEKLEEMGARVEYNDPYIPVIKKTREFLQFAGRKSVPVSDKYDLILIATAHDTYRTIDFKSFRIPVVDTRNVIKEKFDLYCSA
jgi:UDP-N-acetyl-D-glucosamine dehydrogenase